MKLKKIDDGYYFGVSGNKIFTLKKGERGVYGFGHCYRLRMVCGETSVLIACFATRDDGYGCYKQDYKGRLWVDINDILRECEMLIDNILK